MAEGYSEKRMDIARNKARGQADSRTCRSILCPTKKYEFCS